MPFTVAILGRPNVGKSTLFNRLVGKKLALVDDLPGVTRDRREGEGSIGPLKFRIIDTAGLEEAFDDSLEARMRRQTEAALEDADVAMLMIDARAGVTPLDKHFCQWLRAHPTPSFLVANKCEGKAGQAGLMEAFELGFGEPVPISAEHGEGMSELHDALEEYAPENWAEDQEKQGEKPLMLAIIGRPNAGKSTLINQMIEQDRLLTGPEAGITRDSISIDWTYEGQRIRLFDTAGMRRKSKVTGKLEKLAVTDGLRAVQFAEIVVLLIDATMPLEKQDLNIARHALEEGRGLVLGVNKWDLIDDPQALIKEIRYLVEEKMLVHGVPIVTLSALTGRNIHKLMPTVLKAYEAWNKRVSTAALNRWLEEMTARHPPPMVSGRRYKIRYATQVKSRPPTFSLFTSSSGDLPKSYLRYLTNGLRDVFRLDGTPIRIEVRKSRNPYEGRAKKKK